MHHNFVGRYSVATNEEQERKKENGQAVFSEYAE